MKSKIYSLAIVFTAIGLGTALFENCAGVSFDKAAVSTSTGTVSTASTPLPPETGLCFAGSVSGGSASDTRDCASGLKGTWYYYPNSMRVPRMHEGGQVMAPPSYISLETFTSTEAWNQGVAYSQMNIPGTDFRLGLQVYDPATKQVSTLSLDGHPVTEWFALKLEGYFHLRAEDAPGTYQIGVVADDGAIVYLLDDDHLGANPQTLVYNSKPDGPNGPALPGTQPPRLGCSSVYKDPQKISAIPKVLDANSSVHMRVLWYQGPQGGLAFTMVYRLVPASGVGDVACEAEGNYGPSDSGWTDLASRGWKVVNASNLSANR